MSDELEPLRRFILVDESAWLERGLCRKMVEQGLVTTAEFFPERGESTRRAKSICNACVVRPECWDYANRAHAEYGIWGGKSRQRGKRPQE